MEEIADRLRKSVEDARGTLEKSKGNGILSIQDQRDVENRVAFDYAKENGLWVDNFYSLGNPYKGGNENTIVLDTENHVVYKSNNLFNSQFLISGLLKQIRIHNELFPETNYKLVGFTGIDYGKSRPPYIEVVMKQDFISNFTTPTPQEIADFMSLLDFEQVSGTSFINGQYTVSDLYPRNVLKDEDGIMYVIDDIVSES
ncbi:hypothetical protein FW774_13235 [Pedobacter sp. BS3]|uniref:putative polyvalent protein kinase domain-containing protein n=1 Tax=Pedobacter sp. BS3 TaxID=2567937 RepID=UPI0011F0404C|nr:hypothetical protein [Pedobacter sp. BS3]TZF83246.1 hypothetical protein FW774_13235 [Pedobacter sp. BS3]